MGINRGDIFYVDLGETKEKTSIQTGIRPAIIISNNKCNKFSPILLVAPLTSKIKRTDLPIHIELTKDIENGLELNSIVLLEQIRAIDREKIFTKIGSICGKDLENINKGLEISLGLNNDQFKNCL